MGKFTGHTITSDSALGAAKIKRSLRFYEPNPSDQNSTAATNLTRTPSSTGNRKIWTFSSWIKKFHGIGTGNDSAAYIYGAYSGSDYFSLYFQEDRLYSYYSPGNNYGKLNDRKFRDVTSWFHLVHQVDATNTTQSIWINGEAVSLDSDRNPGNNDYPMNQSGVPLVIGKASWKGQGFNGYLAEVHLIDGSLVAPTDFGFTDPVTNIWTPKRYEGTHGTNGFYLDFSDNTGTTTLGIDKSTNGNDLTANNFSVAVWPDNDSVIDTPTNSFNTFNDNDKNTNVPLANGGLETAATATGGHYPAFTTIPVKSGKWYLEWKFLTNDSGLPSIMEANHDNTSYNTDSTVGNNTSTVNKRGYGFLPGNGNTSSESGYASYGSAMSSSDIGQCAFDADTGKIYWGKNGTFFNSGNPETGANPAFSGIDMTKEYLFTWHVYGSNNNVSVNFGAQGFTYTPPAGFKALCQQNLPLTQSPSVVTKPQKHFDTLIWDGNSTQDRNITGLEFKPDFVWIKARSHSTYGGGLSYHHLIWDVLRGVGSNTIGASSRKELTVNEAYTEGRGANYTDYYGHVSSFNEDGFQLDHVSGEPPFYVNQTGREYVAWCWKAGGAAVANNDGSVTSQVSVNREAGFSIATLDGTGSVLTFGHGLGATPTMVILKARNIANNWLVYHQGYGATKTTFLDTAGTTSDNAQWYNDTEPTSSVFTLGTWSGMNTASSEIIAYCWTDIPGYSKFGLYTGNGSSNGQFVHLGFRPAMIMLKNITTNTSWVIYDNKRSPLNEVDAVLYPNGTGSEATGGNEVDFVANGFNHNSADNKVNSGNKKYIYMAFAEQPGITSFDTFPNAR